MIKRVLFIGPYPPPYGGIASHLYDILPRLHEKGYEVISLTLGARDQSLQSPSMKNIYIDISIKKKYVAKNFFIIILHALMLLDKKKDLSLKKFIKNIIISRMIAEIQKKENVDVVIYYEKSSEFIPICRKLIDRSVRIYLMLFGEYYLEAEQYKKISRYMKNAFDSCDRIMSSSKYCADSIQEVFRYYYPILVIYVGVDHNAFAPTSGDDVRRGVNIPPSAVVFLFFGRMHKSMGLDFLLKTAPRLLNIRPDLHLYIAGARGDLSANVEMLASNNARVNFVFDVPFNKKRELYGACDVFLAPTMEKHACMGVSIKEAMACGKPILASASGGIPEAVEDGVNGYVIPFTEGKLNEDIFLSKAEQLANNALLRTSMGQKGREKVMRLFTNDETTRRYLEVLSAVEQNK